MNDATTTAAKRKPDAPFAYEGLERVIHEKARLGILASLATHADGLAFSDLKQLCALTDGNLNRHLQVLQEAGLVEVRKAQRHQRPQTLCQLTAEGRAAFRRIHRRAGASRRRRAARPQPPKRAGQQLAEGWSPA